ncbi:MAG: hypothetical protein WKF84_18765, partial [Pyrinomonadaceae bacterium]
MRAASREAIISASADNRYGHPSQLVLDRLRAAGIKVYRTDLQGEITIVSGATVMKSRPPENPHRKA